MLITFINFDIHYFFNELNFTLMETNAKNDH